MHRPTEPELAAIAAAYIALQRTIAPATPAAQPRWRLAGRGFEAGAAADIRASAGGSAWRNAGRCR